ncbi:MAG TPA: hypothetical protein VK797_23055 [Tepidisphaeraceae bacterium]|jgi:hypothetical protein|nr:hypothetical protein [Tepidisphaeraceae bacterium]
MNRVEQLAGQLQPAKPDGLNLDDVAQMLFENNQQLMHVASQARGVHDTWRGIMFGEGQKGVDPSPIRPEGRAPLARLIREQRELIDDVEKMLVILHENLSNSRTEVGQPLGGHQQLAALR